MVIMRSFKLPDLFRKDYLFYQERFRNDDIKYSLKKAAKTVIIKSESLHEVKINAIAYGIYAYLKQPFRDRNGEYWKFVVLHFKQSY